MKRLAVLLLLVFGLGYHMNAQDKKDNRPVRFAMESTLLIDNPSFKTQNKGQLALIIHHRFGEIKQVSDLFGVYAPANTRLGLNYGITDRLMVSIGTEKNNKYQDLDVKYMIMPQTSSGSFPVFLTYFGSVGLDARDESVFGENYNFIDRFSYFHELIIGRKFTDALTLQTAVNFSHFNAVDSVWNNDYFGFHIGGRYKITTTIAAIAEYDQAFSLKGNESWQNTPEPNYAFGIEIGTSTHCFQLFAATYDNIIYEKNFVQNQNTKLRLGFNITVRFN